MTKEKLKLLAPYAGLPLLAIALLVLRLHSLSPLILLQRELLLGFGYVLAVTDLRKRIVPNQLVLALLLCWCLTVIPSLFSDIEGTLTLLKSSAIGFFLGGGLFLLIYFISKGGLGGGDVKLVAVMGLYLGLNGILPALLLGSILAALFCLVMVFLKKLGRKDAIPLVPFLYLGALIPIFFL